MGEVSELVQRLMGDVLLFAEHASGLKLRRYQEQVARAVVDSVINARGETIVVMFPRQSGKNELQAQMETYLLTLYSSLDVELVKVSPTWKPQTLNAMRRLERVLERNLLVQGYWSKSSGYIYQVGRAVIFFLSGEPTTSVVGATANLLLQCDEAQDVRISKWDKDFAPMAASTNATRVFWGTAWTSRTLLARELRAAREKEAQDGKKRVFVLTADDVRAEVPAYGDYVAEQVAKLGRNHPLIRTQYFSEMIDAEGGMFNARRIALMHGGHEKQESPEPDSMYALLLDVAGEDENAGEEIESLKNPGRDSTALTVIQVDLATLDDDLIAAPTYKVVNRYEWIGDKHTDLYGQIRALAEHWGARYLVVDATGVGAGLASFLDSALPGLVIMFVFTPKSKSDLGWNYLAVIETGRYKEYLNTACQLQRNFWLQVDSCQHTVLDGPGKMLRWGVPDGTRDPATGELIHDDLLISAALCSALDEKEWGIARSDVVNSVDPLADFEEIF